MAKKLDFFEAFLAENVFCFSNILWACLIDFNALDLLEIERGLKFLSKISHYGGQNREIPIGRPVDDEPGCGLAIG